MRISSGAYATEESASDAKTGSAMRLGSSVSPSCVLESLRPMSRRLPSSETWTTSSDSSHESAERRSPTLARVHIVIMGCGRVGSTLARSLEKRGHTVAVIDVDVDAFRRLGPDFGGRTVKGVGFDREVLVEAGIEAADGFAAVSSRRQLQHPGRPGRARDVRRRERRRPHLRPGTRRGLRAAGHPHRRHRALDVGPGAAPAAARRLRAAVARPVGHRPHHRGARRPVLGRPDRRATSRTRPAPACPSSSGWARPWSPRTPRSSRTATSSTPPSRTTSLARVEDVLAAAPQGE